MRTALGRVTGLGSARDGTARFWRQRLTAAANVPLVLFFVWLLASNREAGRGDLQAAFANPAVSAAAIVAMISVCWHMRLGMQAVIEDYVESNAAKVVLTALNAFFAWSVAVTGAVSVLLLALGR